MDRAASWKHASIIARIAAVNNSYNSPAATTGSQCQWQCSCRRLRHTVTGQRLQTPHHSAGSEPIHLSVRQVIERLAMIMGLAASCELLAWLPLMAAGLFCTLGTTCRRDDIEPEYEIQTAITYSASCCSKMQLTTPACLSDHFNVTWHCGIRSSKVK